MAASSSGDFSVANELPPVAPRQELVPKNLIECRVSVVPRLPVVNLEKPSSAWPDLTPSPVPRVSLIPPTGRFDGHALAPVRHQPTIAPRLRAGGPVPMPTPVVTMPHLMRPPRLGRWARLARDLRSSKREIALGLGIGIGLSLLLGKLGQTYLESRRGGRAGAIEQWTASALPSPEPRTQFAPAAAAAAAAPAAPAAAAAAAPAAAAPAAAAAAPAAAAAAPAPVKSPVPPRAPRATKRRTAQRNLPPIDTNPWGTSDSASPNDEMEPRGKSPLTPSESAGLGRELPL